MLNGLLSELAPIMILGVLFWALAIGAVVVGIRSLFRESDSDREPGRSEADR